MQIKAKVIAKGSRGTWVQLTEISGRTIAVVNISVFYDDGPDLVYEVLRTGVEVTLNVELAAEQNETAIPLHTF